MTISLPTSIDTSDKTPRVAIAFDKTSGGYQNADTTQECLFVGQMTSGGANQQAANVVVLLLRATDGGDNFGYGSILDIACKAAFLANPLGIYSAVGIADAGVNATATVTFAAGNALGSTIYRLRINFVEYDADVTVGDTPTIQATSLLTAINSDPSCPVVATSAAGVVTLTAKNGGTIGNGIQLRGAYDASASFVGTTATLSAASLAGGTGSASTSAALTAAAGYRYHKVCVLVDDSTAGEAAAAYTDTQGGPEVGFGEVAVQACAGNLTTATTLATAVDGDRHTLAALYGSESWSVNIAAAYAGVMTSVNDPTQPLNNMVLPGIAPPPVASRWMPSDTKALLNNGVTPLVVIPGELVAIQRAVTTGVTNVSGDKDYSTLDVTKIQGFDYVRDNIKLMFDTNYPDSKWADDDPDGLLPNNVATPSKVTTDLLNVCRDMEALGVLQNVEALAPQILVEKNGTQCIFSVPGDIVDGMHEKFGKVVNILSLPVATQ